jgi:hypothetical protein
MNVHVLAMATDSTVPKGYEMTKVTDHIDAVIAAIKAEDQAILDMEEFVGVTDPTKNIHGCGTSACIAGFSLLVSTSFENVNTVDLIDTFLEGPKFGLDETEATDLFFDTSNYNLNLKEITKSIAIAALEDVRRTGRFTGWNGYTSDGG